MLCTVEHLSETRFPCCNSGLVPLTRKTKHGKDQGATLFVCFRLSLCSRGYPGTHSVDQAGLNLRDLPASASQVLGLKKYTPAQLS